MSAPVGTITFLFTDVEGSTRLWEQHPAETPTALYRHEELLRQIMQHHDGYVFKTVGDALCIAFHTASDALGAALSAQRALIAEPWPSPINLKVRMALHTGVAELRDNDYFGPPLNRLARLVSLGHGGQILLSLVTEELVRDNLPPNVSLRNLGEHRLRDLNRPETVFQTVCPDLPSQFAPLRSLDNIGVPNNLPQYLTSFVGRENEIRELISLIESSRLLTLTGSGGAGKTRLALQVAADILERFPEGVWLVELAPLSDPTLLAQTIMLALNIPEQRGQQHLQTLTDNLKSRNLLLILDNCEHILTACTQIVAHLFRACPQIKVLTTSRQELGIGGERVYRVPSLSIPDLGEPSTPESLSHYEAARLFIERATFHRSDFDVNNANAPALAQICHRLDGIPLALELAAARVRTLRLEEINDRLTNCFRLLVGGDRSALPRQQTLRALIDWSYNLLSAKERVLLARLSVFSGGWSLVAAESVCADTENDTIASDDTETIVFEDEVMDLLISLTDKSLVNFTDSNGVGWYRMLEMVRQYSAERLAATGETDRIRLRHRDYYLSLAEASVEQMLGPDQKSWLERLEMEHDNIRAAFTTSAQEMQGAKAGLRLSSSLLHFWFRRGFMSEGRKQLEAALARDGAQGPTVERASALNAAGRLAALQGDLAMARDLLTEGLDIWERLEKEAGIEGAGIEGAGIEGTGIEGAGIEETGKGYALTYLGHTIGQEGKYSEGWALLERGLQQFQRAENRFGIALSLLCLGVSAFCTEDYATAKSLFGRSLEVERELGDQAGISRLLYTLGHLNVQVGDLAIAQTLWNESLDICIDLGDHRFGAYVLIGLGDLAREKGDNSTAYSHFQESLRRFKEAGDQEGAAMVMSAYATMAMTQGKELQATWLLGSAAEVRQTTGIPLPPNRRAKYEQQLTQLRISLGEERFSEAWEQGRTQNWRQVKFE